MSNNKPIRRITIVGTGVIGASWAALFLAKGLEVVATDPAPNAETRLREFVASAWPALTRLYHFQTSVRLLDSRLASRGSRSPRFSKASPVGPCIASTKPEEAADIRR